MLIQKKNLLLTAAAILALGAGPSITGTPLFRVARISIEGLRLLEADEITALSGISAGANLYEMDVKDAVARIQAHPMVRDARIVRTPPDGVLITVTERTPIALTNLETLCGVDEGGVLIPFHPAFVDLPVITNVSLRTYTLGDPVSDEGFVRCLTLLKGVRAASPEFWDQISEVRPAPDKVVLSLVGDGLEVWMTPEDTADQAEKFTAWQNGAKYVAPPGYVDLRFNGQVVLGPPKAGPGNDRSKEKTQNRQTSQKAWKEVPAKKQQAVGSKQ